MNNATKEINLLGTRLEFKRKQYILEKISLYMSSPDVFLHITSINPEIMTLAYHNPKYANVLSESDIHLCDGVGILLGCSILGFSPQERISGSDFIDDLLQYLHNRSLRVLIIGGKPNLAEKVANCYNDKYPSSKFMGIEAIKDIKHPTKQELEAIFSIVADYKPQILFAAFGSPHQELWFWDNRDKLKGVVCMGVGGGLDFLAGAVPRAPLFLRKIGLEWLFRLIVEPWRWKRQIRLIEFMYLVLKQKFGFLK